MGTIPLKIVCVEGERLTGGLGMKCLCLRNCAVDRYYEEGKTYDIPDDVFKSPKNFKPVEEPPAAPVVGSMPAGEVMDLPESVVSDLPLRPLTDLKGVGPKRKRRAYRRKAKKEIANAL